MSERIGTEGPAMLDAALSTVEKTTTGSTTFPASTVAHGSAFRPAYFGRLWRVFMDARIGLAAFITVAQLMQSPLSQWNPLSLQLLCFVYLLLVIGQRISLPALPSGKSFESQWIYTAGLDLFFFSLLHLTQIGAVSYTPLLMLPILMASILGSRPLSVGTATLAALTLVGTVALQANASLAAQAADFAETGFVGLGLIAIAWLTNYLAQRLAREEQQTAHGRAELRMQTLVNDLIMETLDDGILVVDGQLLVRSANPAARNMLGSDLEVTSELFSLRDSALWAELMPLVQSTLEGSPVPACQITLHHEQRPAMTLQIRTERTAAVGDSQYGLCVMFLQNMEHMQQQLRVEKLASMGRMSAAVAHEFRNPLAAIGQASALLGEEMHDPVQLQLTHMIGENVKRLTHIVSDILDVAQVHPPTAAVSITELDTEVAEYGAEWVAQNDAGTQVQLFLDASNVAVRFLPDHLRRILVNLLDNASRYASENPGAIRVETYAPRYHPAVLQVWSDGAPIDHAAQERLFEPFFSSESRSSGLGLFICQQLCEQHGARLVYQPAHRQVNGRDQPGNLFTVYFRRAVGAPPPSRLGFDSLQP